MAFSRSIRLRLTVLAFVTIVAALSGAGFWLVRVFEHHVEARVVAELEADVGELIAGLSVAADGTVTIAREPIDPHFQRPFSGTYWQVQADGRTVARSRSLWDETIGLPGDDPGGGFHRHIVVGPQERPLIAVERAIRVERDAGAVNLRFAAAQDRAETLAANAQFAEAITAMLVVLGGLLVAAFAVAISVGLGPLNRLRSDLANLKSGSTARLAGSYPSEVALLVVDLNRLLDDRERSAERKRQRAADLAHGLKTPITAISGIAEEIEQAGQGQLSSELKEHAEIMLRHVERELALSRSIHLGPGAAPTRLAPLVQALVRSLERSPRGCDLTWTTAIPDDFALPIDPAALAEILGALLDNARKWASREVRIEASRNGDARIIEVTDDGPGVGLDDPQVLVGRGRRLDSRQAGSGLGLAIAADIAEELGGGLTLANRPGGGFSATVTLAEQPSSAGRDGGT